MTVDRAEPASMARERATADRHSCLSPQGCRHGPRRVSDPGQIEMSKEMISGTLHLSPTENRESCSMHGPSGSESIGPPITSEGTCIHATGQSWHCLETSPRWSCSSGMSGEQRRLAPPDPHPYHGRVEGFRKGPSSALCPETGPDSRGGGAGTASETTAC